MKRRRVQADRSVTSYYHRETVMKVVERLLCHVCGTLMYEGPKPTFSAVSCPRCKAVIQIKK